MRKIIAIYEVIAGILTLTTTLILFGAGVGSSGQITTSLLLLLAGGIILGAWLLIAGIMLFKNKSWGFILSILIQLIQIITIQTPQAHFQFFSPAQIEISFSKLGSNLLLKAGSFMNFIFAQQPVESTTIGVNVIALAVCIILIILFRKRQ